MPLVKHNQVSALRQFFIQLAARLPRNQVPREKILPEKGYFLRYNRLCKIGTRVCMYLPGVSEYSGPEYSTKEIICRGEQSFIRRHCIS